jgi:hypothetical protein
MHCARKFFCVLFTMCAVVALAGCATSIQPLGSPDVAVDVAGIAGEWTVERSHYPALTKEANVRIIRRNVGVYDFEITQAGKTTNWAGDAVKLGDKIFADVVPNFEPEGSNLEELLLIATHVIFVMENDESSLKLYGFDHARLDPLAVKERLAVASSAKERLVFTADPKKLQSFFKEHGPALQNSEPVVVLKKKP